MILRRFHCICFCAPGFGRLAVALGLLILILSAVSSAVEAAAPPALTTLSVGMVDPGQVTLSLSAPAPVTARFVVLESGLPAPTPAQIAAGTGASSTAVRHGSLALSAAIPGSYLLRGLAAGTNYVAYATSTDEGGNPAATSLAAAFVTPAPRDLSGLGWWTVGDPNFTTGRAYNPSMVLGPDHTPYVAFQDSGTSNKATVMRYEAVSGWRAVGKEGFSNGAISYPSLAMGPDGTLYVAYRDGSMSNRATVSKYDATNGWTIVGSAGFTAGAVDCPNLVIGPDGVPYIAYVDGANGNKATVKKYNATTDTWTTVGPAGFSADASEFLSTAMGPDGSLSVAYMDRGNGDKATVMRYDAVQDAWVSLGGPGFSPNAANYTSLAIGPDGTPYIAFMDTVGRCKAMVMRYDVSTGWTVFGGPGISEGRGLNTRLAVGPDGAPSVAYIDSADSNYVTVMRYAASNGRWTAGKRAGYANGIDGPPVLVLAADGTPDVVCAAGGRASVTRLVPVVTSVAAPAFGSYAAGRSLTFTVSFSAPVIVDAAGGTPTLPLIVGYRGVAANYDAARSASRSLAFTYTVQNGDDDLDGIEVRDPFVTFTGYSLSLNGGTILDGTGAAASLALAGIGDTSGLLVDTVMPPPPLVTAGAGPTGDNTPTLSGTAEIGSVVKIYRGGTLVATLVASDGTWNFTPTIALDDGSYDYTITATDAAGNSSATAATVTVDTVPPPTLAVVSVDQVYAGQATFSFTAPEACSGRFVALAAGALAPTAAQICAGTDASGVPARHGSLPLSTYSVGRYTLRNLAPGTAYKVYALATDPAGNSSSLRTAMFTTVATARDLSALRWNPVGRAGFSASQVAYTSLAMSPNGTPYVSYRENSRTYKANVMKYDAARGTWAVVGRPDFSAGKVHDNTSLAMGPDGTPSIAYYDDQIADGGLGKAALMKYDATTGEWQSLDDGGFYCLDPLYIRLACAPDGAACFSCSSGNTASEATLIRCDPTSGVWTAVGPKGFSAGEILSTALAFAPDGSPYVGYRDYANSNRATVMKYNASAGTWAEVGGAGFSAGVCFDLNLAIGPDGMPYVAYEDGNNSFRATVRKYVATSGKWVAVGGSDFAGRLGGETCLAIAADGTPYLACRALLDEDKWQVMKYVATNDQWVAVGGSAFLSGAVGELDLALAPDGTPYVAFCDGATGGKMTVMTLTAAVATVEVPAPGTYGLGRTLTFKVNYSDAVAVDTTGGTPTLPLTIGSEAVEASYDPAASTTTSLVFTYKARLGDKDTDGIALGSMVVLNGSRIVESSTGFATACTLNNVGDTSRVLVSDQSVTFASWAVANFTGDEVANPAIGGVDADPDGVGLSNLLRYAFALAARGPVTDPTRVSFGPSGATDALTLRFPVRDNAVGLVYEVQSSQDLRTWTTQEIYTTSGTPRTESCTVAAPVGSTRLFLRLRLRE